MRVTGCVVDEAVERDESYVDEVSLGCVTLEQRRVAGQVSKPLQATDCSQAANDRPTSLIKWQI